jgi:hypothetical protein
LPATLDRVLQTASLGLTVAIPLIVLLRAGGIRHDRKKSSAQPTATEVSGTTQQPPRLVISTR